MQAVHVADFFFPHCSALSPAPLYEKSSALAKHSFSMLCPCLALRFLAMPSLCSAMHCFPCFSSASLFIPMRLIALAMQSLSMPLRCCPSPCHAMPLLCLVTPSGSLLCLCFATQIFALRCLALPSPLHAQLCLCVAVRCPAVLCPCLALRFLAMPSLCCALQSNALALILKCPQCPPHVPPKSRKGISPCRCCAIVPAPAASRSLAIPSPPAPNRQTSPVLKTLT